MNAIQKEWIDKAEGDFITALREYRALKLPNYDSAGFYAQQCIEKYMKAFLQMHLIPFQKTHDLLALMELCIPVFPELELEKELLAYLNQFAINYRYPGDFATKEQAKHAIKSMERLRGIFRNLIK